MNHNGTLVTLAFFGRTSRPPAHSFVELPVSIGSLSLTSCNVTIGVEEWSRPTVYRVRLDIQPMVT
jgi:hypothetical protein